MRTSLLSKTLLALTLSTLVPGCGALMNARANVTVPSARVEVRGDARTTAAAGLLASGLDLLAQGGANASRTQTNLDVHTPGVATAGGASTSGEVSGSSTQTTTTTTTASGGGNGLAVSTTGGASSSTTATTSTTVTSETTSTTSGTTAASGTGLASGTNGNVAVGVVTYGRVTGVSITRITTSTRTDILAGGTVTLEGAPVDGSLTILDGSLDIEGRVELGEGEMVVHHRAPASTETRVTTTTRTTTTTTHTTQVTHGRRARWTLRGGMLLVEDSHHRRYRARVRSGSVVVRTEGPNPSGNTVWSPGDGSLALEIVALGDERLALTGDVPSIESGGIGAAGVAVSTGLSARALHALNLLTNAAPSRSPEAMRLAAAVDMVIRESQDPTSMVTALPITGRSVVLLVDVSYSMNDPDPRASDLSLGPAGRPRKFDVARAELVKIIGSLDPSVRVNVVAFSSSANRLWQSPTTVSDAGLESAVQWIAGLRVADETHPLEAFETAASMAPEQIVLVSDGRPSDREEVSQSVLGLATGLSTRMRIDVIGIGPDQDRAFLAALAERGRGTLRTR